MDEHNREKNIAALILAAGRSSRMQHGQESCHKLLLPLGQGTILSHVIAAALASQARPIILILGYQSERIRASLTGAEASPAPTDYIITENTAYAQGMSTSLHKGIQVLTVGRGLAPLRCVPPNGSPNPQTSWLVPGSRPRDVPNHENRDWWRDGRAQDPSLQDWFPAVPCGGDPRKGTSPFPTVQCGGALVLLGDQPLITPGLLNQLIEMKQTTDKRIIAPFYDGKRGNPVLFDADLFPELLTITGDEGGRSVIEKHSTEVGRLAIDDSQAWFDVDTWKAYQQIQHFWYRDQ